MKKNYVGVVDKIRVIKMFPDMLIRFSLITSNATINCIVSNRDLANKTLLLEDGETEVAIYGHVNKRNQLIIEKMMFRNPNSFLVKFTSKR